MLVCRTITCFVLIVLLAGEYVQIGFDIVCRAGIAIPGDNDTNTVVELYVSNKV